MNNPLKDLKKPVNVFGEECYNAYPDESKILMEFSEDGYVTILGHKLDRTYKSFEEFLEYLEKLGRLQIENERLKDDLERSNNQKIAFIHYLEERLEESKLYRIYDSELNASWVSKEETIYQKIYDKYCKMVNENHKNEESE